MERAELILVVDDEPHIREVLRFALERAGLRVAECGRGAEALRLVAELGPSLVVLDIGLPDLSGTEVLRLLRRGSTVPVVFLTCRDGELDRADGLDLGADDYVVKPFSPREMVSRVRAVLRRVPAGGPTGAPSATAGPEHGDANRALPERGELRCGRLHLDLDLWQVRWEGRPVTLTPVEVGLLAALMRRPGRVFSRDELVERMYRSTTFVSDRTVDSHVRRLREALRAVGAEPIETVRGVGYRLGEAP
jgi:two-component system OmpR family response regulator